MPRTEPRFANGARPRISWLATPLGISFVYLVVGFLWIRFSDQAVEALVKDVELHSTVQTYKGWFFVGLSSLLVYALVARSVKVRTVYTEAIADSERRLRRVVESNVIGITFWTADGQIFDANDAFLEMTGYTAEDLAAGRLNWQTITPPEYAESDARAAEELAQKGVATPFEKEYIREDGSRLPVLVGAGMLSTEPETGISFVVDIGERKRWEAEAQRLNQELEHRVAQRTAQLETVNQELEAFSYSVSHDLRASLRSISGFTQALVEDYGDTLEPDARDYLDRVKTGAKKMGALIEDLIKLARITSTDIKPVHVDLSAIAEGIVKELREADPHRRVEVSIEPGLSCHCDPSQAMIVMQNLLENAWKFTSREDEAKIELGRIHLDGQEVLFVKDNGVGFKQEFAQKMFDPFQRLNADFPGSGIGLATVRRIVVRHGGRILAESNGKGATFYFTLQ